ncbi:MAG: BamA/TamA family outer membrane protein [Acidobacteriota bacterium]|nr:BamA/TamA family outer membrane protein [Acidobacteriota bacterium]
MNMKIDRAALCVAALLLLCVAARAQSDLQTASSSQSPAFLPQSPAVSPSPQPSASPAPPPGKKITKYLRGVKYRERNFPERSTRTALQIGSDYTSFAFGGARQGGGFLGGIELSTADKIPSVEFRATAQISTKLYQVLEGEAYVPRVGDERTHADIWFNYTRRTRDAFFGIGPRTSRALETDYSLLDRSFNAGLFRDFTRRAQAGVYLRFRDSHAFRGEDDSQPAIESLFSGARGTVPASRFLPGLDTSAQVLSFGAYGLYDRRDNSRGLTRGAYLYGRLANNDGLKHGSFTDYGWIETELDGRAYVPLGSDKTSAALRAYAWLKDPKGGSQIPFYDMAFLGGRTFVRGFHTYRYFGNNLLLFSTELRQTVWSKSKTRGVDVFGFGDAGQVWGDKRSLTDPIVLRNDRFDSGNWRASVGVGAQYRVGGGLTLRLDFAHSSEANKIYFSFSRGF